MSQSQLGLQFVRRPIEMPVQGLVDLRLVVFMHMVAPIARVSQSVRRVVAQQERSALVQAGIPFRQPQLPHAQVGAAQCQLHALRVLRLLADETRAQALGDCAPVLRHPQRLTAEQGNHQPHGAVDERQPLPRAIQVGQRATDGDHERSIQSGIGLLDGALHEQSVLTRRFEVLRECRLARGQGLLEACRRRQRPSGRDRVLRRDPQDRPAVLLAQHRPHVGRVQYRAHDHVEVAWVEDGGDDLLGLADDCRNQHGYLDVQDPRLVRERLGDIESLQILHARQAVQERAIVQHVASHLVVGQHDVAGAVQHEQRANTGHRAPERAQRIDGERLVARRPAFAHADQCMPDTGQLTAQVLFDGPGLTLQSFDFIGPDQLAFRQYRIDAHQQDQRDGQPERDPFVAIPAMRALRL